MRHHFASSFVLAGTLVSLAQPKPPTLQVSSRAIAEWQQRFDDAARRFESGNTERILAFMTPDFTMTTLGQTQNRKEVADGLRMWYGMVSNMRCSFKVVKVQSMGQATRVTVNFKNTSTMKDPKTGKPGKLVDSGIEMADWVKSKGTWMMKRLIGVKESVTLDGKPMKM